MNYEKEAKNQGWEKLENGMWIIDNNVVTDGFVERHIKRVKKYQDELFDLRVRLNNVINDVLNVVQESTPVLKDDDEWRESIFKRMNDVYQKM